MRIILFLVLSLMLAVPQLDADQHETIRLETTTELTDSPDGHRLALLTEGIDATVLETRNGWVRVGIEGWVAIEDTSLRVSPDVVAATPPPVSGGDDGLLTGAIYVTNKKGKTIVGSGTAVRLVEGSEAAEAIAQLRESCESKREEVLVEASRLKEEAGYALSRTEDTSEAFEKYDEANGKRRRLLKQLKRHDDDCDFRMEEILGEFEVARGLSDAEGRFSLRRVPGGSFVIWARFDTKKTRYVWEVPVTIAPGEDLTLDLTNLNLTRTVPIPKYK